MAISDKLLEINQVKEDLKQAIIDKGVSMDNVPFTDYPEKVLEISGGGGESNGSLLVAWQGYKRTPELKYDLNLTYVTDLMGFFNVYSGDSALTQLYNDCVSGAMGDEGAYIIEDSHFENLSYLKQYYGDVSDFLDFPVPTYSFGISEFSGGGYLAFETGFLVADLTPLGMGVGISLLKFNSGVVFNNIKIYSKYLDVSKGLIVDLNEIGLLSDITYNIPLCIDNTVTTIGEGAFSDWTSNNQPLVIPDSVTSIGEGAFRNWTSNNQPLVIPNSVTSIGEGAFQSWNSNSQPLVIPDSVTSIGYQAFIGWDSIPHAEIHATTPPTLGIGNFDGSYPIYVPDASVDDYKTATNWVILASRIFSINDK